MTPEELAERFAARFGHGPDGVWRAPGRVNLIGEHTDYNGGFVLPFAIQLDTHVAAGRRDDRVVSCTSVQLGQGPDTTTTELAPSQGWWTYAHGVVAVFARAIGIATGVDLLVSSDVPIGAGLSSSAALECAVAVAMRDLTGAALSEIDLALIAQRAENEFAGVPCGVMDQMASMLGLDGHALLIDTRSMHVETIPFPPADTRVLVVPTSAPRALADGAYAERRATCEEAARELGVRALRDVTLEELEQARPRLDEVAFRRARHVVTENERVLAAAEGLRTGDFASLGAVIDASHRSLRDDFEVSTPELDRAVGTATSAGAIGARMTGAGFGGCAIAIVPDDRAWNVRDALAGAGFPHVLEVHPSDGARRLDM